MTGTKAGSVGGDRRVGVDVLVITAIKEEYEAARAVAGASSWTEHDAGGMAPYATATLTPLSVAIARPTRMGGRNVAAVTAVLTDRLKPRCVAMCGVCAGNPRATAPGDVIVAAPAYEWDEGKHIDNVFRPDYQQFPQDSRWVRAAQDFVPAGLPSYGAATPAEAAVWFLERLYRGQNPRTDPARDRYFPGITWGAQLKLLESEGLVEWRNGQSTLTGAGHEYIERALYFAVDGPARLPFVVRAGAMASGSAVVAMSGIWDDLEARQRDILALDMEAATIATVAHERQVPHWLVAKGVMDHADPAKGDRFKAFAAKASAEVLFALLRQLMAGPGEPARPAGPIPDGVRQGVLRQLTYYWQDLADAVGAPSNETRRFRTGDEPYELWTWLQQRGRLADLPAALAEIGRGDLATLLLPYL